MVLIWMNVVEIEVWVLIVVMLFFYYWRGVCIVIFFMFLIESIRCRNR